MVDTNIENEEDKFDFSSTYSDNFPKILKALNISLAVTSYQSERLILVRSDEEGNLDTNLKAFPRPMGVYVDEDRITLGTLTSVVEFRRSDEVLESIKKGSLDNTGNFTKKVLEKDKEEMQRLKDEREKELSEIKKADSLYLHRASLTTGMINIHDIAWGDEGLWVVNSTFSCLSTLSPDSSFVARWKPPFISELVPEDRCHLNGMAMLDGKPKYVTTFNKEDTRDSWNETKIYDGTLIDVDTNEILIDGMIMPHSPKVYNGEVYVCDSGYGTVFKYNPITKERTQIVKLQGFTRGLYFYGGIMFVGTSQVRVSDMKNPMPISKEYNETYAGVWMINLEDNSVIGYIKFDGDVDQIYDVAIIPDSINPEIISEDSSLTRHIFDFKNLTKEKL
ncbi:TIGR03032 family protein [Arcobacter sp. YIC-464]|uniref:TIGR03032 family protein n=1 Tax=Arcobacter sp. YIC-464 TaxID=3376631 RepID=UPI003C21E53E